MSREEPDLGSSQLHVRSVDLAAQQLVQCSIAGEDDGLVGPLDAAPSQAGQVGSNTHAPASDKCDGQPLPEGLRVDRSNCS